MESTGQAQEISPIVLTSKAYRVVRTEPLAFDRFDRRRLYFGSNVIFATDDAGRHWRAISPDLTRAHPGVPPVLGSFESNDPQHGTHRGVVYALAPSYRHRGTLWAGTDDGLVWITRDGGARWRNVTPPGLAAWSKVAQIDASRSDDDTAFVAVTRFRLDDLRPYVFITHDGGARWQPATNGLPNQPVNAVRQDPLEPRLLYVATENGVFASFDAGAHWQSLQLNLPHTSVRDIIVHGNDAIVATHGRGFWILDDVTPLRELAHDAGAVGSARSGYLFAPPLAYRVRRSTNTDTPLPPEEPAGQNPPDGAIVDYVLPVNAHRVVVTIFDGAQRVVRRYASDDPEPPPIPDLDKPAYWERPFGRPSTPAGMHRFVWDLREPPPQTDAEDLPISAVPHDTPRVPEGALVVPGRYIVALDVDGAVTQRSLTVAIDPRTTVSPAALGQQYAAARTLCNIMNASYHDASAAKALGHAKNEEAFTAINQAAAFVLDTVEGADAAPTSQAAAAVATLRARLERAERGSP
ncbi:MAG: hypothetical protein JOY69_04140 [Candidatus Eremiobacteraeota bacterium]|nr:hypothetical protein [Candidatus Eremiobacteraeota bacterium]